jgi:hypothetical protein
MYLQRLANNGNSVFFCLISIAQLQTMKIMETWFLNLKTRERRKFLGLSELWERRGRRGTTAARDGDATDEEGNGDMVCGAGGRAHGNFPAISEVERIFRENLVDGELLLELDREDLMHLGIVKLRDVKSVLRWIANCYDDDEDSSDENNSIIVTSLQ